MVGVTRNRGIRQGWCEKLLPQDCTNGQQSIFDNHEKVLLRSVTLLGHKPVISDLVITNSMVSYGGL